MPKPVLTPLQRDAPLDSNQQFNARWYLYFTSVTAWLQELIVNSVYGRPTLLHVGRVTKVSESGTIGEARFLDTEVVYRVQSTQAGLTALAASLTILDAGKLVEVTDYRHVLRWTGTAWECGPGETLGGFIQGFAVDPDPATGWQLCDGTTVAYLKKDGTTANFATPDLVSAANKAAYLKLGTPVSGPTAAVAPVFTGTPVTPTGTVSSIAASVTPGNGALVAGAVNAIQAHVHPAPTFTGNSLTPAGTIDATAEPRSYELRPWFRR